MYVEFGSTRKASKRFIVYLDMNRRNKQAKGNVRATVRYGPLCITKSRSASGSPGGCPRAQSLLFLTFIALFHLARVKSAFNQFIDVQHRSTSAPRGVSRSVSHCK